MKILLNNNMRKRLNSGVDVMLGYAMLNKYSPITNYRVIMAGGGIPTHEGSWSVIKAQVLSPTTKLKLRTNMLLVFKRKVVNFLTASGSVVATYSHLYPDTVATSETLAASATNIQLKSHLLNDNYNNFSQTPEGNVNLTLIPSVQIPVLSGSEGLVIAKVEVTYYDVHDNKRAFFEASVSDYAGDGTIKMTETTATKGGYVRVIGLDNYVIKAPNSFEMSI